MFAQNPLKRFRFGKSGVIVTSFNNAVQFQRYSAGYLMSARHDNEKTGEFFAKYLDTITSEEENKYLGSEFCISNDCGTTFGELHKSPVTSPHGPCLLHDGTILWVGRTFSKNDSKTKDDGIKAYKINIDGTTEIIRSVPEIKKEGKEILACEPHAVQLNDGRIICHIRLQGEGVFTIYQSVSDDGGKTWSNPEQILDDEGGAPSHLFVHSTGVLVAAYGYRKEPYGIKVMFSKDGGKSWDKEYSIFEGVDGDIGYPCSVELKDKSVLTVFYTHDPKEGSAVIMQQKWSFEDED